MKTSLGASLCIILLTLISCRDTGEDPAAPVSEPRAAGMMLLKFAGCPPQITTVVATLTHSTYTSRILNLTITGGQATGEFQYIPAGTWHLKVDALDSASVVCYSGETDVQVFAFQKTTVTLQLKPTTGSIEVIVTWGESEPGSSIQNGSFELGPGAGSYLPLDEGSTVMPGWIVTRGQIDLVTYWQSYDGSFSLDLDGTPGRGGVKQILRTLPGTTYVLQFALAGNPEGPPTVKTMGVSAGGETASFTFDTQGKTIRSMGWVLMQWKFKALTDLTIIEFYSMDPGIGKYGPALDAVAVYPSTD